MMAAFTAVSLASFAVSVLVATLTFITYKLLDGYLRNWYKLKKIPEIPGTRPIIGNVLRLESRGQGFFGRLIYSLKIMGHNEVFKLWIGIVPLLVLCTAEATEVVLGNSVHMEKSDMYRFLHPWLGTGLLTSEHANVSIGFLTLTVKICSKGAKWRQRRKMLTPTFHFSILTDFLEVMNEQAGVLVEKLRGKVGKGPFNCFSDITLCALDIICETAMGKKINAQSNSDSEYVTRVYEMSEIVSRRQRKPWFWSDFLYYYFGDGKKHDKTLKVLHSFTQKVIKERAEILSQTEKDSSGETKKRKVFLDLLLQMKDEDGQKMSHQGIQEEVDTFMFRGHDTTAASMNWALHLIGSHPEVQNKVRQELREVFGESDRVANIDDLKRLRYLECVIKETLRLYPSVPFIARTLGEDTQFNGYSVPKGVNALILPYSLHRNAKYFPNPNEFQPERFLPENSLGRHPYAYIPFSAGIRNCIGQRFALMEEKVVLSAILRNFRVEACQKCEDLCPLGELILRPLAGIWIKLESIERQE